MKFLKAFFNILISLILLIFQISFVVLGIYFIYKDYGFTWAVISAFLIIPIIYFNFLTWKYIAKNGIIDYININSISSDTDYSDYYETNEHLNL